MDSPKKVESDSMKKLGSCFHTQLIKMFDKFEVISWDLEYQAVLSEENKEEESKEEIQAR